MIDNDYSLLLGILALTPLVSHRGIAFFITPMTLNKLLHLLKRKHLHTYLYDMYNVLRD